MDVWLSGPPNTQCQRYLLVPLTMKCATKVTSVEHVPLVGVAVSETTTGAMPVLAPADIGMAGAGAVDVVAVDGDLLGAGPVGALVAGTLVGTPVAGPVTAGRVPVAADPPPDTTWLGWRVAYKPARTMTHASPAAMASRRIGRRRRPGPAPGVVAAGGAACGVRSAVASARSSVGGSPAAGGGCQRPLGHREFRLLHGRRRKAEPAVQQRRDQWNPAGPAEQQQLADVIRGRTRGGEQVRSHVDGPRQQPFSGRLERLPPDVHVLVDQRDVHTDGELAGERLLGRTYVVAQLREPAHLGRGGGRDQPPPCLRRVRWQRRPDQLHQQVVEVDSSDVLEPARGEQLVALRCPPQQAGLERSRTEVVHEHAAARPHLADGLRLVPGSGHRRRYQGRHAESGAEPGLAEPRPPGLVPGRRGGEHKPWQYA